MKVLVIEDEAEIRNAYCYVLVQRGYQALAAANADQGFRLAVEHHPRVILLDMLMPGMSGLEFLKNHDIAKRFPRSTVVAISNIDNPNIIAQAKDLGVAEYILKVNITPDQMADLVVKLVGAPKT